VTCVECRFSYALLEVEAIPGRLRSFGPGFHDTLAGIDPAVDGPEVAA